MRDRNDSHFERKVMAVVISLIIAVIRIVTRLDDANDTAQTNRYDYNYLTPSSLIYDLVPRPTIDYQPLATSYSLHSSFVEQQATIEAQLTEIAQGIYGINQYPTPTRRPVNLPPTATPNPTAIIVALADGTHNGHWHPLVQQLDSVAMVLVPAGCYQVDSTTYCVEKAFWLDRYEVTNSLYGSDDMDAWPVVDVTWQEAKAFCEYRGGRLPTAIEWQYAASGPDGWDYPWGIYFEETFANSCDNHCSLASHDGTYDDGYGYLGAVNRYEQGSSWVGAYNMSGNVAEWVKVDEDSSRQAAYGGSWADNATKLQTTSRELQSTSYHSDTIGFRCARDY